jgi:hypothetical protein
VILKDAHVSARKELEAKESIKKQIRNTFKSNPLPMKKNFIRKQIIEARGYSGVDPGIGEWGHRPPLKFSKYS